MKIKITENIGILIAIILFLAVNSNNHKSLTHATAKRGVHGELR